MLTNKKTKLHGFTNKNMKVFVSESNHFFSKFKFSENSFGLLIESIKKSLFYYINLEIYAPTSYFVISLNGSVKNVSCSPYCVLESVKFDVENFDSLLCKESKQSFQLYLNHIFIGKKQIQLN